MTGSTCAASNAATQAAALPFGNASTTASAPSDGSVSLAGEE